MGNCCLSCGRDVELGEHQIGFMNVAFLHPGLLLMLHIFGIVVEVKAFG